jgi:uncharacterized membrane protein
LKVRHRLFLILILPLLACGPGPEPNAAGDDSNLEQEEQGLCEQDPPLQSWETFGRGFVTTHCQGCHASTAPNRYGAPENVVFDSQEQTVGFKSEILATAALDAPTMPPTGGTSENDRMRLRIWLECFSDH